MSLQIIYGRSGCGKTQYIFNEISKNIDNGRKKYIITPEQFSFSAEKVFSCRRPRDTQIPFRRRQPKSSCLCLVPAWTALYCQRACHIRS